MSAPKIENISENLSSCSLTGSNRSDRSPPLISPAAPPVNQLPPCWEQCHEFTTGEVYYFNWSTGRRTAADPRLSNNAHYSDEDSEDDDDKESSDSSSQHNDADTYFSSGDSCSTVSSTTSSACSPEVTSDDSSVLVATGCRSCYMYFMVPKYDSDCPRCGGLLLHFGSSG